MGRHLCLGKYMSRTNSNVLQYHAKINNENQQDIKLSEWKSQLPVGYSFLFPDLGDDIIIILYNSSVNKTY